MNRTAIVALKALIVVMIALMLICQVVVVPSVAEQTASMNPDVAFLEVPGILFAVAFLVCVQLALICVWRLLSLVGASVIFSEDAFKWVDGILALVVIATLLILGALVTFQLSGVALGPLTVICLLGVILGAGFALLVVVLRGLLRQASQLERDLSEVV
jgi:hypothetical protein